MNPISPKSVQNENNGVTNEESPNDVIKVKLCDFSFSQIMKPGKTILGMMGTAAYSGQNTIFFFLVENYANIFTECNQIIYLKQKSSKLNIFMFYILLCNIFYVINY